MEQKQRKKQEQKTATISQADYEQLISSALGLAPEQQQVFVRGFSTDVIMTEFFNRMRWLQDYKTCMDRLADTFCDRNYIMGKYTENSFIKKMYTSEEADVNVM